MTHHASQCFTGHWHTHTQTTHVVQSSYYYMSHNYHQDLYFTAVLRSSNLSRPSPTATLYGSSSYILPIINAHTWHENSELWPQFCTAVAFESPKFQNRATYMKRERKQASYWDIICVESVMCNTWCTYDEAVNHSDPASPTHSTTHTHTVWSLGVRHFPPTHMFPSHWWWSHTRLTCKGWNDWQLTTLLIQSITYILYQTDLRVPAMINVGYYWNLSCL